MRLAVVDKDASEAEKLTDGIRKSAEDIEIYRYKAAMSLSVYGKGQVRHSDT